MLFQGSILSLILFIPTIAAVILLFYPNEERTAIRWTAVGASLIPLALSVYLWFNFGVDSPERYQFIETRDWYNVIGSSYQLGVDGIALTMVLLTTLLTPLALLASFNIQERVKAYMILFLLLETGMLGVFMAVDLLLFFVFWEIGLVPMYFLISQWGGQNRNYASLKFILYTMAGSLGLLLAIQLIGVTVGSFDMRVITARWPSFDQTLGESGLMGLTIGAVKSIAFWAFVVAFAIKVPVWPFHTWQPATYAEAPTSTTLLLTGVMSKMGAYGFLRILLPIFPEPARLVLKPLLVLAAATVVCSACAAFAQRDLKRMLAYSSMNHLGYCLLGMFAATRSTGFAGEFALDKIAAINGVMLQMFNHGITAATLFCFVAFLENRSGGLRGLNDFGGLRKPAPVFAGLMGIAIFASIGLPGLSGFVGEFLIFKGSFVLAPWATAISSLGLLLTAVFLLTLIQRVFAGPLNPRWEKFPDLTTSERLLVLPGLALIFVLGLWPQALVGVLNTYGLQFAGWMNF